MRKFNRVKETEKAICVTMIVEFSKKVDRKNIWVPKSCVEVADFENLSFKGKSEFIKDWFLSKKIEELYPFEQVRKAIQWVDFDYVVEEA